MWMPVTTGHHGWPPDRIDELDNFLPEDKAAARDFLIAIKPLFPLIEIPAFWDEDEGVELIKQLSRYILQPSYLQTGRDRQRDFFHASHRQWILKITGRKL